MLKQMDIDSLVDIIVEKIKERLLIPVEASGRHVHLSKEAVEILFGKDYELTPFKNLSQPGQYACKEKVTIIGPKGMIKNIAVLGPTRKETQVEISKTDAVIIGIDAPIRESGNIQGSKGITIATDKGELTIKEGVIVAKRHIHFCPEDAEFFGVKDKDIISVEVLGERPLIFHDVVARVNKDYRTFMHIDYDEANACGYKKGTFAKLVRQEKK